MEKDKNDISKIKNLKQHNCLNPNPEKINEPLFLNNSFFDTNDHIQVKYEMIRKVKNKEFPPSPFKRQICPYNKFITAIA